MEVLTSDLLSLLQDSSSSDLSLICPDGQVDVHRLMMSARSPVFNRMLKDDMVENTSGVVEIEDFKIDVVRAMVKYIYTAKIDVMFEDIRDLLVIGDKYQIQTLVDECSKMLMLNISWANVLDLGVFAEVFAVEDLMKACAKFISENSDVLDDRNWNEKVKNSPLFLISIVEFMKPSDVEFPRFGSLGGTWDCGRNKPDAITVLLSCPASLTSIGLYGTKDTNSIPLKVDVKNDSSSSTIYSVITSYKSTGNNIPIKVPIGVRMEANTKYTISAVISSDTRTYYGVQGKSRMEEVEGGLRVDFVESSESANGTHVGTGQIPTLSFKM